MHYAFDTEFQVRLYLNDEVPILVTLPLAKAVVHERSKSAMMKGVGKFVQERYLIKHLHGHKLSEKERVLGDIIIFTQDFGEKIDQYKVDDLFRTYLKALLISPVRVIRLSLIAIFKRFFSRLYKKFTNIIRTEN
jgi:hypothetical protein